MEKQSHIKGKMKKRQMDWNKNNMMNYYFVVRTGLKLMESLKKIIESNTNCFSLYFLVSMINKSNFSCAFFSKYL